MLVNKTLQDASQNCIFLPTLDLHHQICILSTVGLAPSTRCEVNNRLAAAGMRAQGSLEAHGHWGKGGVTIGIWRKVLKA